jgi:hypothetical protein
MKILPRPHRKMNYKRRIIRRMKRGKTRNLLFSALFCVILCSALFSVVSVANAERYTGTDFQILDPVIGAGAERGTSGNFILWQSLGEIGLGLSTNNFRLNAGFLTWPTTTPASGVSAAAGSGQATVSWTAGAGALGWTVSGYTIGQSTTSGGPYSYTSVGNVTSSTRTGLTNGTTYYFVVINEDAFGNYIATSTEVSVSPVAAAPSCGDGSCNGSEAEDFRRSFTEVFLLKDMLIPTPRLRLF